MDVAASAHQTAADAFEAAQREACNGCEAVQEQAAKSLAAMSADRARLQAEVERLRGERAITPEEVRDALNKGAVDRKLAEHDNAWTSPVADRDRWKERAEAAERERDEARETKTKVIDDCRELLLQKDVIIEAMHDARRSVEAACEKKSADLAAAQRQIEEMEQRVTGLTDAIAWAKAVSPFRLAHGHDDFSDYERGYNVAVYDIRNRLDQLAPDVKPHEYNAARTAASETKEP